ncbi:MAG TPA: aromatic ring-hydroxylating dioxygenase subunit alpha, partial [Polyangiaceae bacterium]
MSRLRALEPSERHSVVRLANYWYPVALSKALRNEPIASQLLEIPLVVYRTRDGQAAALLDRCPHRNVPLSIGKRTDEGTLRCAYHGWEFRHDGRCTSIPGRLVEVPEKLGHVPAFATHEANGMVWVYATPDVEPARLVPESATHRLTEGYTHVMREVVVEATLHAAIENALDVPHTAFLHGGLFRGETKHRIVAKTTVSPDRVVTEYVGEPRPTGLAARLLSPSGGVVQHWDRFILPSIAEVEYRIGEETHFLVTAACSPVTDFKTKLFAQVSFRTRLPGWLLRPLLERVAMRIFGQDARIVSQQTRNVERFGGEQYTHTELDLMGPAVWRLLKRAEQG